ncbi:MAG: transporter [Pirellulaceae bacterium]|nr:MAG: transporter [Pirellulaceae bacterium]
MRLLLRNWFLALLIGSLVSGCLLWRRAEPVLEHGWLRDGVVAGVLFVMALPLDASTIWQAIRYPWASLLAASVNMGTVPLMAWAVAYFFPNDLRDGLLVAAATPCTLASASVWTRRAGGNDAVSLIVTVVTNLLCFLLTPFWLWITGGHQWVADSVSFSGLGRTLALLVVLPMALAQLLRLIPRIGRWSTLRKIELNTLAQMGILVMVFLGSVQMGRMLSGATVTFLALSVVATVAAVVSIHLAAFGIGMLLGGWMGLSRADRIAVGFAGSQKTLMVGVRVSMELGASILPMVAYHIAQLILDTLLVDYWLLRGRASSKNACGSGDSSSRKAKGVGETA